ncbi:MAG TPA: hypothetical protein VJK09_03095 [Candidatus Paceibacterota bacterium]
MRKISQKEKTSINLDEFKRHTGVLIEHMDERFDAVNTTLTSHSEMIGSMKVDIEVIKTDISTIKFALKRKVDYDEFAKLEKRVLSLEHKAHA